MNTSQTISAAPIQWGKNKSAVYGYALIAFAVLFWIAVIQEQLFHSNWLVENIVVKIDRTSSFLSILLCLVFPLIALIINFIHMVSFNFKKEKNECVATLRMRPAATNVAIIIFCLMNTLMLVAYLFTENFTLAER